jgi:heme/copper-type cytochrome/quinol oxidase subunit 4
LAAALAEWVTFSQAFSAALVAKAAVLLLCAVKAVTWELACILHLMRRQVALNVKLSMTAWRHAVIVTALVWVMTAKKPRAQTATGQGVW